MGRPRRTFFQLLGWVVWKLLSLLGLRYAKERLKRSEQARR